MTHTHAECQDERSVVYNDRVETNGRTDMTDHIMFFVNAVGKYQKSRGNVITVSVRICKMKCLNVNSWSLKRYTAATIDTIRYAILTCAQKLTRVSLIYRTEPTLKVENRLDTD